MNKYHKSSSDKMKDMRGMEEFCDVTLVSDDNRRVRAHKVVLASASSIFRDLFQSNEDNNEYQVVNIRGVKSCFLTAMIDLVYEGETKVKERECEEFLNFARQYKLLNYNSNDKINTTCRYYNRAFCKNGNNCAFTHPSDDCDSHMAGQHCSKGGCTKRHRLICKFWDSRKGCFRRRACQYLHEDPTTYKSKARISGKEKCDACKFDCYNKDQVIVHTIKTHKFKLCLQCDDTIEKKEALLSKTFDLRNILKIKYPDMSSKVLNSLVNY